LTGTSTYRNAGSAVLLLLFLAFFSLKASHALLAHHHDHEADHPVCEVTHDPGVAHIHDERWAVEDCSFCTFVISVPEPFSLPVLQDIWVKSPVNSTPNYYVAPHFSKASFDIHYRRGPPALT
jgi:hypothetical protein